MCFTTSDLELESGFAMNLLDKEMALDTNLSIELVNELTELYAKAIEYYENQQDTRFIDF
jgi:hypothetical protein